MEKLKKIYQKKNFLILLSFIFLCFIFCSSNSTYAGTITPRKLNDMPNEMEFQYAGSGDTWMKDTTGSTTTNIRVRRATLDGTTAYCMDHKRRTPDKGSKLKKRAELSDEALKVLIVGYSKGNLTAGKIARYSGQVQTIGAETKFSFTPGTWLSGKSDGYSYAYMATQLAFWHTINGGGDSSTSDTTYGEQMNWVDLEKTSKLTKNDFEKIIYTGKLIKSLAKQYKLKKLSDFSINLTNDSTQTIVGSKLVIGPYKLTSKGFTENATVSLSNAPTGAQITNAQGTAKSTVSSNDTFYISMPVTTKSQSGVQVTATLNEPDGVAQGAVYWTGTKYNGKYKQGYAVARQTDVSGVDTASVTWTTQTASFQLKKVDENGNTITTPAVFGLYTNQACTQRSRYTADVTTSNGVYNFELLDPGTYYLKEVSAPAGYSILTSVTAITLNAGDTVSSKVVSVKNKKIINGSAKVFKKDQDGNNVAGAQFTLYSDVACTSVVQGPKSTDANGVVSFPDVKAGTYYIKETQVPNDYRFELSRNQTAPIPTLASDGKPVWKVTVTVGNETVVTAVNTRVDRNDVNLTKQDQNGLPVAGAVFELYDSNDKQIGEAQTTTADGKVSWLKVEVGTYKIVEKSVPDGYEPTKDGTGKVINEWTVIVTKDGASPNPVTAVNNIDRKVKLLKKDQKNRPVEGAEFTLKNSDGSDITWLKEATKTTDEKGVVTWEGISPGTYKIVETKVPDGYEAAKDANGKVINEWTVTVSVDKDPEAITAINEKIIRGTLNIVKYEKGTTTPISGVKFGIYKSEDGEPGEVLKADLVSDENGKVTVTDLPEGEYFYNEYEAPSNDIVIDKTQRKFSVTEENTIINVKIENKRIRGKLQIEKIDDFNQPLQGVSFEIYDSENKVVDTVTTDKNGIAESKDLDAGEYTFKEITKDAPTHLIIDSETVHKFVVNTDGTISNKDEGAQETDSYKLINQTKKGKVQILKVADNEESSPLKDIKFDILNVDKEKVAEMTTDENGIATSPNLVVGTYYYQEVSAPDNVVMDNRPHKFELKDNGEINKITVTNRILKGSLVITKKDEAGNLLRGAKFEIYNSEKKKIETVTTDSKGIATVENLEKGTYYYKEVKAPSGYSLDETEYEFKIETDSQVIQKEAINQRLVSKLKIKKLDKESKQPIEGVKFDIMNIEKEIIETIVTDSNGIATSRELDPGTYIYREIDAPNEYMFDDEVYIDFTVTGTAREIEKTEYNQIKRLPQTGGALSVDAIIIIVISVVSTIGYIIITVVTSHKKDKYRPY